MYSMLVSSPVLLPAPPARLAMLPYRLARLARQLGRAAPELAVTPAPPPVHAGCAIACPDLQLESGNKQCFVELVGFWTAEYVRKKLAIYRDAGVDVILCLDAGGACDDDEQLAEALPFTKHVSAAEILGALEAKWGTLCS
jgi:predicted nuclease of restriction endonuclease-like RecB superfamily